MKESWHRGLRRDGLLLGAVITGIALGTRRFFRRNICEMSDESSPQTYRFPLLALLILVCHIGAGSDASAQPAGGKTLEAVTLSVRISVTDKDSGRPVPAADVLITHGGNISGGGELPDITGRTDGEGEYSELNVSLRLTGTPHQLVVT